MRQAELLEKHFFCVYYTHSLIMARKKNILGLSKMTQTMIFGFVLIFAAILVFFADKEYLSEALSPLF